MPSISSDSRFEAEAGEQRSIRIRLARGGFMMSGRRLPARPTGDPPSLPIALAEIRTTPLATGEFDRRAGDRL